MNKKYYVYILTNQNNNVMYVGITGDLSREKQLKAGSRHKKINLIDSFNKKWRDFSEEL